MRRTVESAPPSRTAGSIINSTARSYYVKPDYIPAFSMSKQGKYASYVTIQDRETRQWNVYLCEREDCAHARVHLCTLPKPEVGKRRPPCSRCAATTCLSWHHIYPQRFFKRNLAYMQYKLSLCRSCHDLIETHIPETRPLSPHEYVRLAFAFLRT